MKINNFFLTFFVLVCCNSLESSKLKQIVIDPTYQHDKYNTQPKDIIRSFRAYVTSFDSNDDNNGDGKNDSWGIPEWVSYEIKKVSDPGKAPKRPSSWITDKDLYTRGIAPKDESYKYSKQFRSQNPNWYDRGHMCMKQIAWRLGRDADWNTHTMLNACPQRHDNNAGIWLDMEIKTMDWANKFGSVWVICGPIFVDKTPSEYIGETEKNEMLVAIPDAFFKIVIKENGDINKPDILAFIYPQDTERKDKNHVTYLVSVDEIERKTGLDFLTILPDSEEEEIEEIKATEIWPTQ